MANSLITIILPSYNHDKFISRSVLSVIEQSYSDIELIVIDDGSTDNSHQILDELSIKYGFKFIKQTNMGLSATLNKGISIAKGEYIGFCSSDDELHKDKIKLQIKCLEDNPGSNFCYTKSYVFDDNDRILDKATDLYNAGLYEELTFEDIFTFKVSLPVTGIYRASFIIDVLNGFDDSLSAEDYDINLRIVMSTQISFINEYLYYYRSPAAIGGQRSRPVMRLDVSESHLKTLNKYKNHASYKKALLAWNYRRLVYFSAYSKTKRYAFSGMIRSARMAGSVHFYKAIFRLFFYWK